MKNVIAQLISFASVFKASTALLSAIAIFFSQTPCLATEEIESWAHYYELGDDFFEKGQYQEAEDAYARALDQTDHDIVKQIVTLSALADVFHSERKRIEEICTIAALIRLLESIDGYPPLFIGRLYLRISSVFLDAEQMDAAYQIACIGSSMVESSCGKKSPNFAWALNCLAWIEFKSGRLKLAERHFMSALQILEQTVGNDAEYYGLVANNLATLFDECGDIRSALKWIKRAKDVLSHYSCEKETVWRLSKRYNALLNEQLRRKHKHKNDALSNQQAVEIEL
jgi:tetratricopeptide (TPR) repeat protein